MNKLLLTSLVLLVVAIAGSKAYPFHASCTIDWFFKAQCEKVNEAIVNQIKKWSGKDCENRGEKCLYHLESSTATDIKVVHETPKAHYLDDLEFQFASASSGCKVHGQSSSETWYAVLDKGTNYCNLHNLITGAGLDKYPGYNETTSNSECTEYTSANCKVY